VSAPAQEIPQERRKGERRRAQSPEWLHLLGGALPEDRRKAERRSAATGGAASR